ncbi:hypothetical protein [Hyphomicrobium sp. ghe19]|uniref:hypothetical protein n=1 Tax=Hyphomicrobium sp. ghe19 TaxID=2682968 RepID=UPI001367638A|nr:hypothetical protein HYPP_02625 [Hyphomicrobium sp. ghe19]
MSLALAKSHRFVIRNEYNNYVAHRGHDSFGTFRNYTGKLSEARIYIRESDASRVASLLDHDYGGKHTLVPLTLVMIEENKSGEAGNT